MIRMMPHATLAVAPPGAAGSDEIERRAVARHVEKAKP